MPLDEVEKLLDPLIDGDADYSKGNRFLLSKLDDTLKRMPKTRLIGNWIITSFSWNYIRGDDHFTASFNHRIYFYCILGFFMYRVSPWSNGRILGSISDYAKLFSYPTKFSWWNFLFN